MRLLWLLSAALLFGCAKPVEKGDSFVDLSKLPIFTTTKSQPTDAIVRTIELGVNTPGFGQPGAPNSGYEGPMDVDPNNVPPEDPTRLPPGFSFFPPPPPPPIDDEEPFIIECGDGILDESEECDDGNSQSGDGCNAHCRAEYCGNGIIETGETCDLGQNPGALSVCCSSACQIVACTCTCAASPCTCAATPATTTSSSASSGQVTTTPPVSAAAPTSTCGNGILEASEGCDDSNRQSGDGCDALCQIEEQPPTATDNTHEELPPPVIPNDTQPL